MNQFMNQSKQSWKLWASACAVAGVLMVGGCKNQGGASGEAGNVATGTDAKSEIVLGLYTSMTGGTASFGKSTDSGIKMAIAEANASGGVLGRQIRVQLEDNGGKPDQAVTAVQKLISSDNVVAILGDVASSNSLAAAPICQNAKVPMLSPTSTNPKVTQVGDYIFRACFIDPDQGPICARFAKDQLKAKTAAVFIDTKSDYSRGLAKYFIEEFSKTGKIVKTDYYSAGDNDFRAQLTNIKATNPDVLFIPGYYTEVGAIALQARELKINQPLLGGDGWDSPKLTEIGKDAVQGSYFSTHYSSESTDPRVKKFVADFKKQNNGETPDALCAVAYDSANMMLAAIKKAGVAEPNEGSRQKIRDALAATKDFPGVTGNITLNKDRNAVKQLVMVQVKGNDFKYVSTVKP